MSRKPRRRLPDPIGYTTRGGDLERDLFLIRTARDLTDVDRNHYLQLEANRYDATVLNLDVEHAAMHAVHRKLLSAGLEPTKITGGAVVHRVDPTDLPPRLRQELAHWSPAPGAPAAEASRDSIIPWLLLARLPLSTPATVASAVPFAIYNDRRHRDREILKERIRQRYGRTTACTVERVRSHIAEMGQARYTRFARHERSFNAARPTGADIPPVLNRVPLQGIRQDLINGYVSTSLEWQGPDRPHLVVTIAPRQKGEPWRYDIPIPTPAPAVDSGDDAEPRRERPIHTDAPGEQLQLAD